MNNILSIESGTVNAICPSSLLYLKKIDNLVSNLNISKNNILP